MASTNSANASLPSPIYESHLIDDTENTLIDHNNAMTILENILTGSQTAAAAGVNASVVNTGGKRLVNLQLLSAGCIASIVGAINGSAFTLRIQSAGSIGMADVGAFVLNAVWQPGLNDTLTLIWDGTNFIEIARSDN